MVLTLYVVIIICCNCSCKIISFRLKKNINKIIHLLNNNFKQNKINIDYKFENGFFLKLLNRLFYLNLKRFNKVKTNGM